MRATLVSLCPTQAATDANRPALTPELLAATGARYSRSNEGLDAILSKIDPLNPDKSVDSIFKMVDYGHASIADIVPVAIFMDGISMWLAYHIWALCPLAGGQESSTRYIRLSADNLPDPNDIGIPAHSQDEWRGSMNAALDAYEAALAFWEEHGARHPELTRIPTALLNDPSEKAAKAVARMKRNYAFDRARYFLPAALKTNVMMVQSARAWVSLCQQLLSHPLPEPQRLGELIREELALVAPRLIKHATAQPSFEKGFHMEWERRVRAAKFSFEWHERRRIGKKKHGIEDTGPHLEVWEMPENPQSFANDLQFHDNRYAFIGSELQLTPVRFGWTEIAFGDVRDLNRHRTGTKTCDLLPRGFYGANDQTQNESYLSLIEVGERLSQRCMSLLQEEQLPYIYWLTLGTQVSFQHTTTADKFIYEAELRTGVGAHYRYAKHLRDVLELWYQRFPSTRGLILEGSAEPE